MSLMVLTLLRLQKGLSLVQWTQVTLKISKIMNLCAKFSLTGLLDTNVVTFNRKSSCSEFCIVEAIKTLKKIVITKMIRIEKIVVKKVIHLANQIPQSQKYLKRRCNIIVHRPLTVS